MIQFKITHFTEKHNEHFRIFGKIVWTIILMNKKIPQRTEQVLF